LVYRTRDGRLPFDEWLRGLRDDNAVARTLARIGRVRRGNLDWSDYQKRQSK
jgi:putative component of toxin-antitoxin plasmid stabilization module